MSIDFPTYLQPARFDVAGGILTGIRLINAKPDDVTEHERDALTDVREATVDVQRIAKLRDRLRPQNLKSEDRAFDASWGAVQMQLAAWARMSHTPPGQLAEELLTSLFPDGLVFVSRSYEEEWVASKRLLERIDEEGLEESLTSLVHPDLLALTREAHDALGQGLGVGDEPFAVPDGDALYQALRQLSLAIARYARVLAGRVDERDDASVQRFRSAMAPLEAYRAAKRVRRGSGDGGNDADVEPVDPEAPAPVPTDEPSDDPVVDEPIPPVS